MTQSLEEEEEVLKKAIEESKKENPNPDNMSYEEMIDLGERVGKVSKGLTPQQIAKIPVKNWRPGNTNVKSCAICYEDFGDNQKVKFLRECKHEYHETCINKWLENEKRCPVCNRILG